MQLELLPQDFSTLKSPCTTDGTGQYGLTSDCPIYRALKRQKYNITAVAGSWIRVGDDTYNEHNMGVADVEGCRLKLLNGEQAFIELQHEYEKLN